MQVFYKRVVPSELEPRDHEKWVRDIASYVCEINFYEEFVPLLDASCLPLVYKVFIKTPWGRVGYLRTGPDVVMSSTPERIAKSAVPNAYFCVFSEDLLQTHAQKTSLGLEDLESCFSALQSFHRPEKEGLLWGNGCYWSRDKRPYNEIDALPEVFERFLIEMKGVLPNLRTRYGHIGEKLKEYAGLVSSRINDARPKTLVHGDLKTANIFFTASDGESPLAKFIDFQWSGVGVPASDIMYLLLSSGNYSVLEMISYTKDGKFFHGELENLLRNFGYLRNPDFVSQCQLVALDYARVVVAYQWKSATPKWFLAGQQNLGRCMHNKFYEHAETFLRIIDDCFKALKL
mmetsp:Transcript_17555/g.38396  ORF Transcript_17555/g.38396 Transcript_17555/m.38396 type:complete len:346 (-) Transcript_17555:49-1086(-)